MFNISTGVQAGPIWSQQQVGQTQQRMRQPPMQMPAFGNRSSYSPQTMQGFGGQWADLMGQGGNNMAMNFGRQVAPINAQHNLQSQNARAGAGVNWANLLANQYGTDLNTRSMLNNSLLQLLQGFI